MEIWQHETAEGVSGRSPQVQKLTGPGQWVSRRLTLGPNATLPSHPAPGATVIVCTAGGGQLLDSAETIAVGDAVAFASGEMHGFEAGGQGLVLLVLSAPQPADRVKEARSTGSSGGVRPLNTLFSKALTALASTDADQACRLAAEAWRLLKDEHPEEAHRMEALLHGLTQRLDRPDDET